MNLSDMLAMVESLSKKSFLKVQPATEHTSLSEEVRNTEQGHAVITGKVRAKWIQREPRDRGLNERQWGENNGGQSISCAISREKLCREKWKKIKELVVEAAKTLNC